MLTWNLVLLTSSPVGASLYNIGTRLFFQRHLFRSVGRR